MKNLQRGFVVPLVIAIIAVLAIGGGVYIYESKKTDVPAAVSTDTQQPDQVQPTNSQNPSQNTQPKISDTPKVTVATNAEIISKLVIGWKNIAPSILPGFPNPTVAFFGHPYTIQFISNSRVIIAYQDDFNPLFAVLNYDSGRQQFSYLDGLRSSPFEVSESLWNTWRNKYGDTSYAPQTYQFSSTRTGDTVYPSDWKKVTKNPFISTKSPTTVSLSVLSPNGGETIRLDGVNVISWKSTGLDSSTITIKLKDESINCPAGILGCQNNYVITYGLKNTGSYSWDTSKKMSGSSTGPGSVTVVPGIKYKIEICKDYTDICDSSNNYFTIDDSNPAPITVISPNGGESWNIGFAQNIKWKAYNFSSNDNISIYLVGNASGCFNLKPGYACLPVVDPEYIIASNIANTGQFQWTPNNSKGSYYIRICKGLEKVICDTSNDLFTIVDPVYEAAYKADNPPIISSITGPTSLHVNETGTWIVNATDSDGQNTSYSMSVTKTYPAPASPSKIVGIKPSELYSSKINWKFDQSGTYLLEFTASDFYGKTANTSVTVNVQ